MFFRMRVGDEVNQEVLAVGQYGTDKSGDYAELELGEPLPVPMRISKINMLATGVEIVSLDPVNPAVAAADALGNERACVKNKEASTAIVDGLAGRVAALEPKPLVPTMVRETLHVRLTDAERDDSARSAARLIGELADAEESFKNEAAAHKARVKECKAEIGRLTEAHNTGLKYMDVTCEQRFDLERGRTWFIYRDESYGERAMTPVEDREARRSLFGDSPMLPNRVDPAALPDPKSLAGDQLAKRLNNDGSGGTGPVIANGEVIGETSKRNVGEIKPGKRRAPLVVESIKPHVVP